MMSTTYIRAFVLAGALAALAIPPALGAAETANSIPAEQSRESDASKLTLKERSSGKGADQQRVNDCKVPIPQRGDGHRPAKCVQEPSAPRQRDGHDGTELLGTFPGA